MVTNFEKQQQADLPRWIVQEATIIPARSASIRHIAVKAVLALSAFVLLLYPNAVVEHARTTAGCVDNFYASLSKSPDAIARKILRHHPLIGTFAFSWSCFTSLTVFNRWSQ